MKNILLTGVAGFIGSHTAKALVEEGFNVVGIDNFNDYYDPKLKYARVEHLVPNSVEVVKGDILNYDLLSYLASKTKFDCIVHLAAQAGVRHSIENPAIYIKSNIDGSNNIFELARSFNIPKVVFASSSSVYGGNKKVPFSEKDSVGTPISIYAASKRMNELQAHTYNYLYGTKMVALRFFTVYGPWGRPDMAAYIFADLIKKGKAITIFNNGNMHRDFTNVKDIVSGIVSSVKTNLDNGFEIFNLGNSNTVLLKDYVSIIEKYMGQDAIKIYKPMQQGDIEKTFADISKAKSLLGFNPQVDIDAGLKEFIDWHKEYTKDD